jgi:hypothetical protein
MRAWCLVVVAACYSPRVAPGSPCESSDTCPSGLACLGGACVDPSTYVPDASVHDAPIDAALPIDAVDARPDAGTDPTLVAYWAFDDTPTDGALDSSGRGHTAVCMAACPTLVTGKVGSAYSFAAAQTQALVVPDSTDFRGPVTIAAWVNANPNAGSLSALAKPVGTATDNSWQLEIEGNGKASFSGGSVHYLETPTTVSRQAWHHLAGTWDGTTKILYLDGVAVAQVASTSTYDTQSVFLGVDENSGAPALYWDGLLDELRVYSRVLTPAEIAALAQ